MTRESTESWDVPPLLELELELELNPVVVELDELLELVLEVVLGVELVLLEADALDDVLVLELEKLELAVVVDVEELEEALKMVLDVGLALPFVDDSVLEGATLLELEGLLPEAVVEPGWAIASPIMALTSLITVAGQVVTESQPEETEFALAPLMTETEATARITATAKT